MIILSAEDGRGTLGSQVVHDDRPITDPRSRPGGWLGARPPIARTPRTTRSSPAQVDAPDPAPLGRNRSLPFSGLTRSITRRPSGRGDGHRPDGHRSRHKRPMVTEPGRREDRNVHREWEGNSRRAAGRRRPANRDRAPGQGDWPRARSCVIRRRGVLR